MSHKNNNLISLAAVIVAAVVFGMVLSGGMDLTRSAGADRNDAPVSERSATVNFLAPDFVDLADRIVPSVVSVRVTEYREASESQMPMDRFHFFFGPRENPEGQGGDEPMARRSEGSGFFISADGEILTNNHVVEGADKIIVETSDGLSFPAEVVGADPDTDLALLHVLEGDGGFHALSLGDSDSLRVGEWVMAAGNPMDMDFTITVGVVSAKGRALGLSNRSFENYIQTDAAINFGNSGGPLVNLHGEVVGINTAINARGQNLGFAVPIKIATRILPQLREHGRVVRGYLGVTIDNIDQKAQGAFGLDSRKGALVISVSEDSPAEEAGLTHGDVIIEVDGKEIDDTRKLIDTISARPPGDEVRLDVIRDGAVKRFDVTLGERDSETTGAAPVGDDEDDVDATSERVGLSVTALDSRTRQMYGIDDEIDGVLITKVKTVSPAGEEGLSRGDVILEANGRTVSSPGDLLEVVREVEAGGYLRLYVRSPRAPQPGFVILQLGK